MSGKVPGQSDTPCKGWEMECDWVCRVGVWFVFLGLANGIGGSWFDLILNLGFCRVVGSKDRERREEGVRERGKGWELEMRWEIWWEIDRKWGWLLSWIGETVESSGLGSHGIVLSEMRRISQVVRYFILTPSLAKQNPSDKTTGNTP